MNLNNKTIFDFCKDKKMLHEIIGGEYSESYYKGFPQTAIASHLMEYAGRINDKDLFEAARRLHQSATDKEDFANEEASKKGQIID